MRRSRPLTPAVWLLPAVLAAWVAGTPPALAQVATDGATWQALRPAQQTVLLPLQGDWNSLDAGQRQKWLELASRYPTMSSDQQQRMQQRMREWARMTPAQRGQARINFQQARAIPAPDRQAQWEAYQALPAERRQALAQRQSEPSPQTTSAGQLRRAPVDALAAKANTVTPTPAAAPRAVGPSLVQAGPGATTRLITQAPPPVTAAASTPRPKIEVGAHAIDRTTLLPKPAAVPKAPKSPPAPEVASPPMPAAPSVSAS